MTEAEIRAKAEKKVRDKKGFYIHFGIFAVVGIFLFVLNYITTGAQGDWWFYYPVLGWGLGVAIHHIAVFGLPGTDILSAEWEAREVAYEMDNLRRHDDSAQGALPPPADGLELSDPPLRQKETPTRNWDDQELV